MTIEGLPQILQTKSNINISVHLKLLNFFFFPYGEGGAIQTELKRPIPSVEMIKKETSVRQHICAFSVLCLFLAPHSELILVQESHL